MVKGGGGRRRDAKNCHASGLSTLLKLCPMLLIFSTRRKLLFTLVNALLLRTTFRWPWPYSETDIGGARNVGAGRVYDAHVQSNSYSQPTRPLLPLGPARLSQSRGQTFTRSKSSMKLWLVLALPAASLKASESKSYCALLSFIPLYGSLYCAIYLLPSLALCHLASDRRQTRL